jgi:hypothetical protein
MAGVGTGCAVEVKLHFWLGEYGALRRCDVRATGNTGNDNEYCD